MAPVAGKPFLHYLLEYVAGQQISHVILSLGHAHQVVIDWLGQQHFPFPISTSIEKEALGTGGGIQLAMSKCNTDDVFVINGDTMLTIDLPEMMKAHKKHEAETTIALKAMEHFERYGTVQINEGMIITSFEEKAPRAEGNINGGVYLIDREAFRKHALPEKFSFEKDYLERFTSEHKFYAYLSEGYFMDIGVPEDYQQAQTDFPRLFHQS
jgi:D-glycero-alpha-D-manno-heptose 1-phosphate guanylyltransferase